MSNQRATEAPREVARSRRGRETMLDMVRSMGLMLVVIFVLLLVTPARTLIFPHSGGTQTSPGDSEQLLEWRDLTGHPAQLPAVPSNWTINAATMSGTTKAAAHLHVGYVTPGEQYAGVDEGYLPAAKLLKAALGSKVQSNGTVGISGQTWTVSTDKTNDTVLSRTVGQFTIVLAGSLPPDQLQQLTSTLKIAGAQDA